MSGAQALLFGIGGKRVNLNGHTIQGKDVQVSAPSTGTATYTLNSSGVAQAVTVGNTSNPPAGTTNYAGEWMVSPPNSTYEARATLVSGTLSSGTINTYQALSTSRSYSVTISVAGGGGTASKNCTITIDIRDASTLVILDTATIVLQSEANSG